MDRDALRMDLADCGSPFALLAVIMRHYPNLPRQTPIIELARDVGIIDFKDLEVDGFEGALYADLEKTKGVILTKFGTPPRRKRFTIGHELGHFLIPSHKGDQYCTVADIRESRRDTDHRRRESQANTFSAGLLMPKPSFHSDMQNLGEIDVAHIQTLSDEYDVSLEATANRYIDLTDDACAIVFSRNNLIRYARASKAFPLLAVKSGDKIPSGSASLKVPTFPLRKATPWTEPDSSVWLHIKWGRRLPTILEQSMRQADGYQITALFIPAREIYADDDDGDERIAASWTANMRRR